MLRLVAVACTFLEQSLAQQALAEALLSNESRSQLHETVIWEPSSYQIIIAKMADILTKLQTCLDQVRPPESHVPKPFDMIFPPVLHPQLTCPILFQLATQLYSTTCYLSLRHPLVHPTPVPDDPYTLPPTDRLRPGPEDTDPSNPRSLRPDSPTTFEASQRELARDLVIKGAQIEQLVSELPGIGTSEEQQERRIRELEGELREMEGRRREKRREMRALVGRLEGVIMGVAKSDGVVVNGGGGGNGENNGTAGNMG